MKSFWIYMTVVFIGLLVGYYYVRQYPNCMTACGDVYREFINGEAVSPTRYRVLAPAIAGLFMPDTSNMGVALGYVVTHWLALPAMLIAVTVWVSAALRNPLAGLTAALITAVYLPLMFEIWGASLYAALEVIGLCLAGLLLLNWRGVTWQHSAYGVLVVIATLNRETGVLLVMMFAAACGVRQRERGWTLVYALLWAGVYGALRVGLGSAPDMLTVSETWSANTTSWVTAAAVTNQVFFLPVWASAIAGWMLAGQLPNGVLLRRLCWGVAVYIPLLVVFSLWNEVRLLLPIMVIALPLACIAWTGERRDAEQDVSCQA